MRLYYFTDVRTAVAHILPERRMKLSQFGKVNDPFELLCADTGDKRVRQILKLLREEWHARLGFISMSSSSRNPLMWAHYADSHSGLCLGLDVARESEPTEMQYEPERVKILLDDTQPLGGFDEKLIRTILTTKFQDWAYEREWRLFGRLEEKDPQSGLYFVDFSEKLELREVIAGVNCPKSVGQLAQVIRDSGPVRKSVILSKARAGFQTFEVVRQKKVNPIVVRPHVAKRRR